LSCSEFPNGIMHDWVIGIIASLKGKIEYVAEPTILYRQHGKNDVGAQEYYKNILKKVKKYKEIKKDLYKVNLQLENIFNVIQLENVSLKNELTEFINLPKFNTFYRKYWILKNNYMKKGGIWKIAQVIVY
ncbi:MAG: hypothetical protein ACRC6A_02155, partial [Fusobacteriaceae bacterium]